MKKKFLRIKENIELSLIAAVRDRAFQRKNNLLCCLVISISLCV
jgi:hypothetical protein